MRSNCLKVSYKSWNCKFFLGRLEIVSGGLVMPDEASTHYSSVIDQLIEGHQWVWENFGVQPVNSWSIDPFGHSATMPYLWKESGMSNMVIGRIHQGTKGRLVHEKSLEFYWKQYWDNYNSKTILCHVMPYITYDLHETCGPNKFVCIKFDSMGYLSSFNPLNVSNKLYEQYRLKSSLFPHDTILVPLGGDFRYVSEVEWDQQYANYHKLMQHMNSKPEWRINMKFGTINDYFKELEKTRVKNPLQIKSITGDFFPYSDRDKAYWTGYFSTRSFDKRFSREVESRLRASEILHTIATAYSKHWNIRYKFLLRAPMLLKEARDNLGLFLHHDAIIGTSKDYVVRDYEKKLLLAFDNAAHVLGSAAEFLLTKGMSDSDPSVILSEFTRSSFNKASTRQKISPTIDGTFLILNNPTGHYRSEFIEVIVDSAHFQIKNSKGKIIQYQINPLFASNSEIDEHSFEVVFLSEILGFGIEVYTFYKYHMKSSQSWAKITNFNAKNLKIGQRLQFQQTRRKGIPENAIFVENDHIAVVFQSKNGLLDKWIDKSNNKETKVAIDFRQYTSKSSGAYIFSPNGSATTMTSLKPSVYLIEGPFCTEVQSLFQNLFHKVKFYHHAGLQGKTLFIQNALDIDLRDETAEIIMRISTSVDNRKGSFFTDENGFQFIGRKLHPTAADGQYQYIERNYYPITTMAFIEDIDTRVTLHTGQAHGAASLDAGQLEVMIERRLMNDDRRGLADGVKDNKLTITKYMLSVEHHDNASTDMFTFPSLQAHIANEHLNQPTQKMYAHNIPYITSLSFAPMEMELPCDVFVVGMKSLFKSDLSYNGTSLVLHRSGYKCGFSYKTLDCGNNAVNVSSLFPGVLKENVRETSLTHTNTKQSAVRLDNLQVPFMEIKSYVIQI